MKIPVTQDHMEEGCFSLSANGKRNKVWSFFFQYISRLSAGIHNLDIIFLEGGAVFLMWSGGER